MQINRCYPIRRRAWFSVCLFCTRYCCVSNCLSPVHGLLQIDLYQRNQCFIGLLVRPNYPHTFWPFVFSPTRSLFFHFILYCSFAIKLPTYVASENLVKGRIFCQKLSYITHHATSICVPFSSISLENK